MKSCDQHSGDDEGSEDEDVELERAMMWYAEEALAVPQIVMAISRLSGSSEGEWSEMAADLRRELVGKEGDYVESIFRAFCGLAQKQVEGKLRLENALFW